MTSLPSFVFRSLAQNVLAGENTCHGLNSAPYAEEHDRDLPISPTLAYNLLTYAKNHELGRFIWGLEAPGPIFSDLSFATTGAADLTKISRFPMNPASPPTCRYVADGSNCEGVFDCAQKDVHGNPLTAGRMTHAYFTTGEISPQ